MSWLAQLRRWWKEEAGWWLLAAITPFAILCTVVGFGMFVYWTIVGVLTVLGWLG